MGSARLISFVRSYWQTWVVLLGPLIFCPILFCQTETLQDQESMRCGYVILVMILYWLTEALPLPVTAMIPMVLLPLMGLMSTKDVAVNYLNSTNYMFFGGLVMAIAVEHCGLHLRVALRIIKMVGASQARLMLGFMITTMFISMWISNTATTAMMLPIVDAVVKAINENDTSNDDILETQQLLENEAEKQVVESNTDAQFTCGDDEYDDTKALLLETELKKLTNGKILTIDQLKNLIKLDDGCGHFEDLTTITQNASHVLENKDNKPMIRTRTMKRLKSQQEEQKQIRIKENKSHKNLKSLASTNEKPEEDENRAEVQRNFLLLGIAISSNIGGTGVVTGTPPNLVAPDILQKKFGEGTGVTFASWMAFSMPVMLVNIILAWIWLQRLMGWKLKRQDAEKAKKQDERAMKAINKKYDELGKMSMHEFQVMILFIFLILLWFFKTPIFMPGWGDLFSAETSNGENVSIAQATPAILICLLLFILPQNYNCLSCTSDDQLYKKSPSLITWRLIETKMCWGVLFLLGGGFTLAKCLQTSGLSIMLVAQLKKMNLNELPGWLASILFTGMTIIITNLCNNTAAANALVPVLADMSISMCLNPIYLVLPASIACSYAFLLPVSTAPNALVFGHSSMRTIDMVQAGAVMNIICFSVLLLAINTYAVPMFSLGTFPEWAAVDNATLYQCSSSVANNTQVFK